MKIRFLILLLLFGGCHHEKEKNNSMKHISLQSALLDQQAEHLIKLPLSCVTKEYPNRLGQTLSGPQDLLPPKTLHPAFYGCFDWHSSVHGHWSLVALLKDFPDIEGAQKARHFLQSNITKSNIEQEVRYFDKKHNKNYERTYGWAWLLKLAQELYTWEDSLGKTLSDNLRPLTDLIVSKYLDFLPKLAYPIRVGEHPNTAFGLSFAWDFAQETGNKKLMDLIKRRAKYFYMQDARCPISWEPGGFDFLSPCLEEAALMKRILPQKEFIDWFETFLPGLAAGKTTLEPGIVTDRTDGKLVHLDGVNFSRAWSLYKIAEDLPQYDHLVDLANHHLEASLPNIAGDDYMGGHWLASFAIFALKNKPAK